jgi:hypothetical protein
VAHDLSCWRAISCPLNPGLKPAPQGPKSARKISEERHGQASGRFVFLKSLFSPVMARSTSCSVRM